MKNTRPAAIVTILLVALVLSGCTEVNPPTQQAPSPPPNAARTTTAPSISAPQPQAITTITVSGKPYRTLAFKPATGYSVLSVAPNGRIWLSCLTAQQSEDIGLCMIDPERGTGMLLVDPKVKQSRIAAGASDGDWLVYGLFDAPQRIAALNIKTGEELEVGRISAGTTDNLVGLVYDISGSSIVWVDSQGTAGKQTETIMLFDLTTRKNQVLATVAPPLLIDQVSISGDRVVWSQVDMNDEKNVHSDVYLYQRSTGEQRKLSNDGRASMPRIDGHYVVWKSTASRFAYGGIYLFDLESNTGKEIASLDPNAQPAPKGYDAPSIGDHGVTWLSSTNDRIELYHPENGTTEILDQGGGKAYSAGHYIVWVNDSVSQKGNWHVLWSDLSMPGVADAAPPTAEATPTQAQPTPAPSQPTDAPSSAPTAPDPADQDMLTYTDPTNSYRLRYPAGSVITADPTNSMLTMVLTREQTVYTTTIGGPVAVPAGAERPEQILETFGQNIGSTSTTPQPLALNGLQAAAIDTTSHPGGQPCPTIQERNIAAFSHGSLYTFRFQISGPGQCNASDAPLFTQLLQSFELVGGS